MIRRTFADYAGLALATTWMVTTAGFIVALHFTERLAGRRGWLL